MKTPELLALLLYFAVLLAIGLLFYFRDRKGNGGEKTYFLGGRNMNGWVSALSAGASDMSAWVLMGLPGSIYLYGVGQVWIAVGLLIGTILAWLFVAPRLRRFSIAAKDAITVPQFLTNRFITQRKGILLISAIVFMVTYCIYAASSIYACGTLFNTVLGMDPMIAMIIATLVIFIYTFLGGYNAVCWTDFFQGLLSGRPFSSAQFSRGNGENFVKKMLPAITVITATVPAMMSRRPSFSTRCTSGSAISPFAIRRLPMSTVSTNVSPFICGAPFGLCVRIKFTINIGRVITTKPGAAGLPGPRTNSGRQRRGLNLRRRAEPCRWSVNVILPIGSA